MKKLAVILSTHNGEKYIREQLDSILEQKIPMPLVIFVRDDGSEDGTAVILREMAQQHPEIVLTNPALTSGNTNADTPADRSADADDACAPAHLGYVASYFALLHKAAEDPEIAYLALSDQDDVWLPGKLAAALRVLQAAETAAGDEPAQPFLYGCTSILVDQDLRRLGNTTQTDRCGVGYYNTMLQNILLGHNQVMNRALLEKLTERQPDLRKIYAHDLWITETASVFGTILFDNEPHTLYRQHRENELGFGTGPLNWILMRIRRAVGGEIEEILRQRNYFLSFYNKDIPKPLKHEMVRYMRARSTFATRTVYALRTRLCRQKTFETVLFKILYIAGIYH